MKSVAQDGKKVKPIPPPTPAHFTDRTTSRTNLTSLKPAEEIFFFSFPPKLLLPFCPFFFYSFFLPSFNYSFVLIFVKFPSYLASIFLYSYALPSIAFLFPFSLLPFFVPPFHFFPTGETRKTGVMKRPE